MGWLLIHSIKLILLISLYKVKEVAVLSVSMYHYGDVIMGTIASQITSLTIV